MEPIVLVARRVIFIPAKEYETIVRKTVDAVNKQDLTILDEVFAENYIDHTSQLGDREAIKQFYTAVFKDFPDFHRTIEDMATKGNNIWVRFNTTATAKGQKLEITSIVIMRIVRGKITEGWGGVIQKMSIPKAKGELIKKIS
jgi:predicted SnoaL-like aldol condensation-catalyzing enzyme